MAVVYSTRYSLSYSYLRFLLFSRMIGFHGRLEDTTGKARSGLLTIREDVAIGNRSYGMPII